MTTPPFAVRPGKRFAPYYHWSDVYALMRRAQSTNRGMDAIDHRNGLPTPAECPVDEELRTAIAALCAGLQALTQGDGGAADLLAQGVVHVQDAELRLRQEEKPGDEH